MKDCLEPPSGGAPPLINQKRDKNYYVSKMSLLFMSLLQRRLSRLSEFSGSMFELRSG